MATWKFKTMSMAMFAVGFAGTARSEQEAALAGVQLRRDLKEVLDRHGLRIEIAPEAPGMRPVPVDVLRKRGVQSRRILRRGAFTSVQVNVDGAGNNIIGDAANEPTLAIDPTNPDRMVIAWRQFDSIQSDFREAGIAYSHDRGAHWTATTLDPGQFRSDPVLGADLTGRFYFSSLSSVTSVELFVSTDGGVSWLPPVSAFGGDKQWITVDRTSGIGRNNIYQKWSPDFSCCGRNDFTRSVNQGASFSSPIALPSPRMTWGTLESGPDGTLYLGGAATNIGLGHVFARSVNAKNPAQTPVFDRVQGVDLGGITVTGGINPAGLLGHVWLATDHSMGPTHGNVYMLGTVLPIFGDGSSNNIVDVHFTRSRDRGETWSRPIRVNDDPTSGGWHWFGTMSVAPNGRIDVIWNDTRNDPNALLSEVFYSFSINGGETWSTNVSVTPAWDPSLGYPVQQKIGDYYHMVSDNGGANLAYAATFDGEENVYFLRIPADCNGNGVEDPVDVAGGMPDCNGNLIPDICEPNADCNGNTFPDICDIDADTSTDCNRDQVPDECQPNEDCNGNGRPDLCEATEVLSPDCNGNMVPDACDIRSGSSPDVNGDGVPDECLGACCTCQGCFNTTAANCRVRPGLFTALGEVCGPTTCPVLPLANNQCAQAVLLPAVSEQFVPIDNRCATLDGPFQVPCDPDVPFLADLWYSLESACEGSLTVSMCDAWNFDAVLAVYEGANGCVCPSDNQNLIGCGDDTCGIPGGPPTVTVPVHEGSCYSIRLGGYGGSQGIGGLSVSVTCRGRICSTNADCEDGNVCTTDRCDLATGTCAYSNNRKPCNDGFFCTKPDTCSQGVCVGQERCPGRRCDEVLRQCFPNEP